MIFGQLELDPDQIGEPCPLERESQRGTCAVARDEWYHSVKLPPVNLNLIDLVQRVAWKDDSGLVRRTARDDFADAQHACTVGKNNTVLLEAVRHGLVRL